MKGNSLFFTSTFLHFLYSSCYLIFSLLSWSLYVSIAWSEEGKWQEACVQAAVFKDNLRRNSYPVMQGKGFPSPNFPFPPLLTLLTLLTHPVLLPLLYLCGLSGITVSCCRNFSNFHFPKTPSLTSLWFTVLIIKIWYVIFKLSVVLKVFEKAVCLSN